MSELDFSSDVPAFDMRHKLVLALSLSPWAIAFCLAVVFFRQKAKTDQLPPNAQIIAMHRHQAELQDRESLLAQRLTRSEELNSQLQSQLADLNKRLSAAQRQTNEASHELAKVTEENPTQSYHTQRVESQLATKADQDDVKKLLYQIEDLRSNLDNTRSSIQTGQGEIGSLIARNHDEIEELRRASRTDNYEFTLLGKRTRQIVGPVTLGPVVLELIDADAKNKQFSISVHLQDKTIVKRNKYEGEAMYLLLPGVRGLTQLTVLKVDEESVSGVLTVPRAEPAIK